MDNETNNPRHHADLIKAWTDGAKIQIYLGFFSKGNVFQAEKEAEVAVKRLMVAFRGEDSEEVKKLRKENEELKLRCENLHKAKEAAIKQAQECSSLSVPLSDGELALVRAIRQAEISYAWERNAAILVDKESFEARRDIIAFITCSATDDEDDEIRYALNKISREQEQDANNE